MLVRLRRPKIVCSPSYADYRPKTNAEILLGMGHTLRGDCTQEGYEKERKSKTCTCLMCSLYRHECRNLKLAGATVGRGLGRSEEESRNEPIGVVIHICMETSQGIPLCSYLHLKLAKTPCFSFSLSCFFFYKIGEQEDRTGSATWGWGEAG
jgi:hypothetical protein